MDNGMEESSERGTGVVITDPKAIRALAHTARLEVIEEMFSSQDTATSTELARLTGLTPSAMSYHLRALEKWGLVVTVPSETDGRERRWKAAGTSLSVIPSASDLGASTNALLDVSLDSLRRRIDAYNRSRQEARKRGGGGIDQESVLVLSSSVMVMTPDQRKDFIRDMQDLANKYQLQNPPDAEQQASSAAERTHLLLSILPEEKS